MVGELVQGDGPVADDDIARQALQRLGQLERRPTVVLSQDHVAPHHGDDAARGEEVVEHLDVLGEDLTLVNSRAELAALRLRLIEGLPADLVQTQMEVGGLEHIYDFLVAVKENRLTVRVASA